MAVFEALAFDGFEGVLARPDEPAASPAPGVLAMPDAYGIGEFCVGQAGRLADLGFIALAGDPYGGGQHAADRDEIAAKFLSVIGDRAVLRANVRTNMDALAGVDGVDTRRLGAIGYCLGGTAVLELARSGYDCRGVVSFHGLLPTSMPASRAGLVASILVCTGADDPHVPLTDVTDFQAEMTAADADCQVIVYTGTKHSWTNPDPSREGPDVAFDARNAARSWDAMRAFLHERDVTPMPT